MSGGERDRGSEQEIDSVLTDLKSALETEKPINEPIRDNIQATKRMLISQYIDNATRMCSRIFVK